MTPTKPFPAHSFAAARTALALLAVLATGAAYADGASGSIAYTSKGGPINVTVKNAYLVKGPDDMSGKPIRRLVFAVADVGPKIKSCNVMSCSDGDLREGMTVDLDAGPRLNYWVVANDQRVQYSGTAVPGTLKLTTDLPNRLAGTLTIDDSAAGGPKVAIQFDATLVKEYSKAR